jgi:aspartokinase-like uncharacterized kinase
MAVSAASTTTTVFKLGGSLLTLPDLGARLGGLLDREGAGRALIVVGGGDAADLVREWQQQHGFDDEAAHWLAIAAMGLNESLVHELLPNSCIVGDRSAAADAWGRGRWPILCAGEFLRDEERRADDPLPHTWDVTSDSIAAWVAIRWPAERLVLLKSTSAPQARRLRPAGQSPSIAALDPYFERLHPRLNEVGWVNVRA